MVDVNTHGVHEGQGPSPNMSIGGGVQYTRMLLSWFQTTSSQENMVVPLWQIRAAIKSQTSTTPLVVKAQSSLHAPAGKPVVDSPTPRIIRLSPWLADDTLI